MTSWKEIHPDFTPELQKDWEDGGFSYEECKEWIEVGLKVNNTNYAYWLKNIKRKKVEWMLNHDNKKKSWAEYEKFSEETKKGLKLSVEAIRRIKESIPDYVGGSFDRLTPKQKSLIEKLIPNEELKEQYKTWGLCRECSQPNTGHNATHGKDWCRLCNSKHFAQDFDKWTSGNSEIDKFIQKSQLEATRDPKILEWIPYERFSNVEFLDKGGFGIVHKAFWADGTIQFWNIEENKWEREKYDFNKAVVLKRLHNSQKTPIAFLQEIANHKLVMEDGWVLDCYGISQDPQTKDYAMVMKYADGGNLRQYLKNNYAELFLEDKFHKLNSIIRGLDSIHKQGLIHQDFHPGNILGYEEYSAVSITDLGLCRPANEKDDGKIYGVLPYVAPEVLCGQPYTQASDIYSLGIVVYELFSELPPYYEHAHSDSLTLAICWGLRPNLDNVKIPELLKSLIKQCWDANSSVRLTAHQELKIKLENWYQDINGAYSDREISEFYRQYQEVEQNLETEEFSNFKTWLKADKNRKQGLEDWGLILSEIGKQGYFKWCRSKRNLSKPQTKWINRIWGVAEKDLTSNHWQVIKQWRKEINNKNFSLIFQTHPQAIYTSRLLNFKNLLEPQNSKEINDKFYRGLSSIDSFKPLYAQSNIAKFSNEIEISTSSLGGSATRIKRQPFLSAENWKDIKSIKLGEEMTNKPKVEMDNYDWQTLHPNFTSELIHQWQSNNFTYEQTREWLSIGLQPTNHHFAAFLRDQKHLAPEAVLNYHHESELRVEYQTYQEQLQTQIEIPPK